MIILNQTIKNIRTAGIALMQICYDLLTQTISDRYGVPNLDQFTKRK
jgi:hypothetical protein